MKISNLLRNIFVLFIFFIFVVEIAFSQLSHEEAKADIKRLLKINANVWEFDPDIQLLKKKLKNNPDPYISVLREELVLPVDDDSLAKPYFVLNFSHKLGLLSFFNTEEARNLLLQLYYEIKERLKKLDSKYQEAIRNSEPDEKINHFRDLAGVMRAIHHGNILTFLDKKDDRIIQDCLRSLRNSNWGLQKIILNYLLEVAPKGDPAVISHLVPLYHDSSYSNSTLHNNTLLGHIIETKEENLDNSDFLSNLITRIQQAYDDGWIDNHGIANSLTKKLEHAQQQLDKGKTKQAINQLNAFLNQVNAQKGNHLNNKAYKMLTFNVEYLLEKLEE